MEEYGGGWTLVTLIKSDKSDQWNPDALYPEDLAAFTTSPNRVSKLSDDEINALLGKGGTRWATAANQRTFYRMTDSPWYSNHGDKGSCNYKRNFYDAWAEPSANPVWQTSIQYISCGGIYDGKVYHALSGSHAQDSIFQGAFNGANENKWSQNGYVFDVFAVLT